MQSTSKFKNSKQIISFLVEQFPACFSLEGPCKPLKVGIFNDLVAHFQDEAEFTRGALRSALRRYTSSWRYLHNVKVGNSRVDLQGNACGEIDAAHAEHAKTTLKASKEKVALARREKEQSTQSKPNTAGKSAEEKNTGSKKIPVKRPPKPIDLGRLSVGQNVRVQVGKKRLPATIKEVCKENVQVELETGLVMRVSPEHLKLNTRRNVFADT